MIRRLNSALPGLLFGIVLYGAAVQAAGVWFVEDKIRYSIGLWIGIVLACGMAVHMAVVLEDAVAVMDEDASQKRIVRKSVLRYLVIAAAFFITAKFQIGNIIMVFIGVMGLKVSAYMQPFIHKVLYHEEGREDVSSDSTTNNNEG